MSTSLLYHAFGLAGYQYASQRFEGGRVTFRMQNAATPGVQLRCGDFAAAKNAGFRCALVF